ncbi:hypothetical protein M5689_002741 [Euphorbia peplus]|nr:hypothetical protein M5689_002741 [Euphorbia peplus]
MEAIFQEKIDNQPWKASESQNPTPSNPRISFPRPETDPPMFFLFDFIIAKFLQSDDDDDDDDDDDEYMEKGKRGCRSRASHGEREMKVEKTCERWRINMCFKIRY